MRKHGILIGSLGIVLVLSFLGSIIAGANDARVACNFEAPESRGQKSSGMVSPGNPSLLRSEEDGRGGQT